jgi:lipopolysaccharide export system protein LptC
MNVRPNNTVRLIVLIAFSAALALGSFWALEVLRRQTESTLPAKPRPEIDFYVEKFNFVRMGKTGEARYNLTGTRMTHNPQDDSYLVQKPIMHSYGKDHPPMIGKSEYAIVRNDSSEIHMYDNVYIDRPASATKQEFQLESSYLLLLPDEDIVKTPKPVELRLGTSVLTGVGMFANNATGEFRLSSNVKGQYQPQTVSPH